MGTRRTIMLLAGALVASVVGTGAASAATPRQAVYFNHAYAVVDRRTADAIADSDYLRAFANFEIRTTTGADKTWTGRYLYGRETYLELFGAGDLPGQDAALGSSGMGLSTEQVDDLAVVRDRLPGQGVQEPVEFLQTRDFGDGVPVPWFDAILTTTGYDSFGAWAMEWRPEYFADQRGNTEPASHPGDVGRERYLTDAYRDRLMRDVTAIRIGVTARDLASTVPLLRAGGLRVHSLPGGGVSTRDGATTIRFDVVPLDRVGLRQIDFALNHPTRRHTERIGDSTLAVGPGTHAVWTFPHR
jgi:uncharacterized protein DUF5829